MDESKIRTLIASSRALADELEAALNEHELPASPAVRTSMALAGYDPLHETIPETADVRDAATRRQKDVGLFVFFTALYAVNRRQDRGLAGSELRELAQSVKYTDLRSITQWERYALERDDAGFRWVTEEGHKWWVAGLAGQLGYSLPDDLAAWQPR